MADQSYSNSGWIWSSSASFTNATTQSATLMNAYAGANRLTVTSVAVLVTTAIVSPDQSVVVYFRRLVDGNTSSGAITLGTITIPDGATSGDVYRVNLNADVDPGEVVNVAIQTPAAGTGAAGAIEAVVEGYTSPHSASATGVAKSLPGSIGKVYSVES